ncbi:hypothetical protein TEA_003321 [Camellia sinensis var. sinensis]|uniref:Auxin-responsive protein n=1 Tax=Camellia sinensis var. sinensis TaxID=542762 RepID=A0A4S4D0Z3_CAMSN|nr:hypothetical protein TEA_003321 [Camellia sinensis var. sinensis]
MSHRNNRLRLFGATNETSSEIDDTENGDRDRAPPSKAQGVGWPPVRSFRKNCFQAKKTEADGCGMYVKVSMDGAPYLRKIDRKVYQTYPELLKVLEFMFKCTIGYNGSEYAPTYEDKDGDWMLVGDVPWEMFITSCKKMRIMRASEAKGLGRASNLRTGLPGLIAEVKKASPSRGVLRENFDPVEIAQAYEKGGAACLSVLTDQKYFQGSFENLEAIRNAGVKCPLLCKEFIIDAWQIYYARTKGADAILLIAAILPDLDIKYMTKICKMLGLAALVEVHNEQEMDRILGIDGVELIGINNRDLETFKVDISNTKKLLEGKRGQMICEKDIVIVGESGLFTPADIAYVQESGVKAVSSEYL